MSYPPLVIAWGKERYHLHWDYKDLQEITLGQFKEICREMTSIPVVSMKVIFSGAILKDNTSTLNNYGLYPGALIRLMGSKINPGEEEMSTEELESIAVLNKLDEIVSETSDLVLQRIRDYLVNVDMFIDQFHSEHSKNHGAEVKEIKQAEKKALNDSYIYLNETLMKRLLTTDGVEIPPGADSVRARRRQVVKQIQSWMDQIDSAKKKLQAAEERGRIELIEKRYKNQL